MNASRFYKRLIIVILLTFCGLGTKLYLDMSNEFRRWGLAIRLGEAINEAQLPQVEALLKEGADPNAADDDDSLLKAGENKPMVRLLLRYEANPSRSVLSARNVEQAQAMLDLGADVNSRIGSDSDTPLMSVATGGDIEMVKFLLQNGADVMLKPQRGNSILEMVEYAAGNHPEMAAQYQAVTKILKQAIARQSGTLTQ